MLDWLHENTWLNQNNNLIIFLHNSKGFVHLNYKLQVQIFWATFNEIFTLNINIFENKIVFQKFDLRFTEETKFIVLSPYQVKYAVHQNSVLCETNYMV